MFCQNNIRDKKFLFFILVIYYLVPLFFASNYFIEIENPSDNYLYNYSVKINLSNVSLSGYFDILDGDTSEHVPFCYEQSNGECNTNPSKVIWVKTSIPPKSTVILKLIESSDNKASNGKEVFDYYSNTLSFDIPILEGSYHNPVTSDLYQYYWCDAGRDAFDNYGYTYLCNTPSSSCSDLQLNIRPTSCSEISLNSRRFLLCNLFANNQNENPSVLINVLLPLNDDAYTNPFSVWRKGNLGSDGSSHYSEYSFSCGESSLSYYMSYDYPNPNSGDPNIFYFMYSFGESSSYQMSYTNGNDNPNEYLYNAKGLTFLVLSPSDVVLGDNSISDFLCGLVNYFSKFKDDKWLLTNTNYLIARKSYDYLNIKIKKAYNVFYSFSNPICAKKINNLVYKEVSCTSLTNNITIYNSEDDMKMEIIGVKEPDNFTNVFIRLNKLSEDVGSVTFVAAIENLSFEKAIVYVPIVADANKQLLEVTKNEQPYVVPKYYLTFEFNETDPIFKVVLKKSNENKENKSFNVLEKLKRILEKIKGKIELPE